MTCLQMGYLCFVGLFSFDGLGLPHFASSECFEDLDLVLAELGKVVRCYGDRTILSNYSDKVPNTVLQRLSYHLCLINIIEGTILELRQIVHQYCVMICSQSKGINGKLLLDVVLIKKKLDRLHCTIISTVRKKKH